MPARSSSSQADACSEDGAAHEAVPHGAHGDAIDAPSVAAKLTRDCDRCCGLCCVGPSFDAGQEFAFGKPAEVPCDHLGADFRCTIHDELREHGFPACAAFECHGAGQRVTQELFAGASWRSSPDVARRVFGAYSRVRMLHESMAMLALAVESASPPEILTLSERYRWLDRLCGSERTLPDMADIVRIRRDVIDLVRRALLGPRA